MIRLRVTGSVIVSVRVSVGVLKSASTSAFYAFDIRIHHTSALYPWPVSIIPTGQDMHHTE